MPADPLVAELRRYLKAHKSPLAPYAGRIVQAGRRYGVDPKLIVAISGAETSFGTYGPARQIRNAWGWGPHIQFGSWQEGIDAIAGGLRRGYLDKGLTSISQIAGKWAPVGAGNDPTNLNSNWVKNVSRYYGELGGKGATGPAAQPFRVVSAIYQRHPWLLAQTGGPGDPPAGSADRQG